MKTTYVWLAVALAAGCATSSDDAAPGVTSAARAYTQMSVYGIHNHPAITGPLPAWMGDGTQRFWVTEMAASGDSWDWFHHQSTCPDNTTCGTFRRLKATYGDKVELIARIDYQRGTGTSLPQAGNWAQLEDWKRLVTSRLFTSSDDSPISKYASTILVGNEVNLCIENGGGGDCPSKVARGRYLTSPPLWTAQVYQAMRDHIRSQAQGVRHDVNVMLEGSAPGGYGNERYPHFVLQALCGLNADVDAIALHAYGFSATPGDDGTYGFSAAVSQQLRGIDEACDGRYRHVPVVITEFSRGDNVLADSNFLYDAYRWINTWNSDANHHGISGATVFHGRNPNSDPNQPWFNPENLTLDAPNNHVVSREAFRSAVAQRWPARIGGKADGAPVLDNECSLGGTPMQFPPDKSKYNITGAFRQTWEGRGGLGAFGYPISNARFETNSSGFNVCTQWFERQRIEQRDGVIEFGLLGKDRAEEDYPQIGGAWNDAGAIPSTSCRYVNHHNICFGFKGLYESTDFALVGLPLSEEFRFTDSHGTFTAQYFERARFEFHDDPRDLNPGLQKGLLGVEAYKGLR